MRDENRKKATLPFKVATTLLYGQREFIRRTDDGTIIATTGPFAQAMLTTNGQLLEAMVSLESMGVISSLTVVHGSVIIKLAPPVGFVRAVTLVPADPTPPASTASP